MSNNAVLIVGGGIGGLTLALALSKRSIPSLVLEQANQFREAGYGILLSPNVYKVFDALGLYSQMKAISSFPDQLVWIDEPNNFEYMKVPMGKEILNRFNYPYGSFHREDLLRVLLNECEKNPYITLVKSARIIQVKQTSNGVTVFAEDGKSFEGPSLIGCDGLWSIVRKSVIDEEKPRQSGHVTHRGFIKGDQLSNDVNKNSVIHWDRPNAHLVQYPVGNRGYFNIVAVYKSSKVHQFEDPTGDPNELEEKFQGARREIKELLDHVDTSRKWLLCDREPIARWSKGRITLLGDAAHPTLPHLAQGAGMAIEDAFVLAQKMATISDYETAFKSYEQERYLRVAFVQYFSCLYGKMHDLDEVGRDLRNQLISNISLEEKYKWLGNLYKGVEV